MAKKQNQAERVFAMLDKEKVKCHITENTLFPAVLLGGTKTGNEERMKYRCAHCRHEWEKVYPNLYSRHNRVLICPNCQKPMFPGLRIPVDSIHRSGTLQLRSGTQLKNFRYVLYVDAATLDDTQGLIISEYEPTIVYHYSDVPESFEVELKMGHYGFVSPSHKILFNEDGSKTTKFLYNAFCGWNTAFVATEEAQRIRTTLPWMKGNPVYEGSSWLNAFDKYWDKRVTSGRRPLGELHAEQTLNAFEIPDMPEVKIAAKQIVGKDISEDVITGKHHMEYCCMECGERFSRDATYSRSNVECPNCGASTGQDVRLVIGGIMEEVGILSMLGEKTLLLRAGKITCNYDDDFRPEYRREEAYRVIIELNPGNDPKIHFLVNEGYGDNIQWIKKKNYASSKFQFSVKQIDFIGELDALKYTGLKEYMDYKMNAMPHSHSIALQDIIHYIRYQSMFPVVEQLCKRGFYGTLEDEIHHRVFHDKSLSLDLSQKKIPDVVGLPERLIKIYLKGADYHSRLEKFKALFRLDPNVREEDIAWLELHGVEADQVADILHESEMSILRLCEYLEHVRINQCFEPKNAIVDWRDYLKAAKTIEVDLTDNKARYPSSLKREHDRAVAKQKLVLDAKKDEFFQQETERYGKLYSYKTDEYMIIPPRDMKDLFEEGRKLNHCVGSYSDRIVEGKTCIMFVRKTEEPDKPYFTIEINQRSGYVVQLRANSNRCVNHVTEKELVKFLREWAQKKKVALNGAA